VTLPASAQRVVDAAAAHDLTIDVVEFPDGTRTAEDAARAVGVEVGQIVKSLVFSVNGETVLALVSGSNRLGERALALATGNEAAEVGRLDADTVRAATGFAVGGVPPFGHRQPLPTFVDRDLLRYGTVWAAAGTPRHVFSTTTDELVRITGATVTDLRETT
jgi:prolyl-tRNA editing enzyme YbaK/EbsC (Cys-tRNA(Pro) deacylase)